jgi:hemolysin activation/secretion protein
VLLVATGGITPTSSSRGTHQTHLIEKHTRALGDQLKSVGDKADLFHLCTTSVRVAPLSGCCRGFLVRGHNTNLKSSVELCHKKFRDTSDGSQSRKETTVVPIGLNFDWKDKVLGTARSDGKLQVNCGRLALGNAAFFNADASTVRTSGRYTKLLFDITRTQQVATRIAAHVRVQEQLGRKNLDSSEDISLGGADSVRAYPNVEAYSDKTVVRQYELRFAGADATPHLLCDLAQGR